MVSRPKKIIIIMSIIILSIFKKHDHSMAKNNDGNIELIRLNQDKIYLENLNDMEVIKKEMLDLQDKIDKLEEDYILTKKGFKVFPGNNSIENNVFRTKFFNREEKLKNPKSFKYRSNGKYIQARGSVKEYGFEGYFSQEDMKKTEREIIAVLDNLDMDLEFLRTTKFVVSPYKIKGSNGYAVIRSNNENTIVISNEKVASNNYKESLKSTILHEIGHVFQEASSIKFKTKIYCDSCSEDQVWKNSEIENFAEEFRIITSNKLGGESFSPYGNKTSVKTSSEDIVKLKNRIDGR